MNGAGLKFMPSSVSERINHPAEQTPGINCLTLPARGALTVQSSYSFDCSYVR